MAGISFFLGRKSSIARAILATGAVFFILYLMHEYGTHMIQVSYLKWIDLYMIVLVGFAYFITYTATYVAIKAAT